MSDNNITTLDEFNNLLHKDSQEAKNFLGFLLGYFKNLPNEQRENYAKVFLGVYENLSKEIKSDSAAFSQVFHRFFLLFPVTEKNYQYYETFNKKWSDSLRAEVRKLNPLWSWDKPVYKNVNELCKVLTNDLYNNSTENILKLIQDSDSEIVRLTTNDKDKQKFINNLHKSFGWKYFISRNYVEFKNFCEKYNFSYEAICNETVSNSLDGFGFLLNSKENFELVLNDLLEKESYSLFRSAKFFAPSSDKQNKYTPNILDAFLSLIYANKSTIAVHLLEKFPVHIKECLQNYLNINNSIGLRQNMPIEQIDLLSPQTWKEAIELIYKKSGGSYSNEFLRQHVLQEISQKIPEIIEAINKYSLKGRLETMQDKKAKNVARKL